MMDVAGSAHHNNPDLETNAMRMSVVLEYKVSRHF